MAKLIVPLDAHVRKRQRELASQMMLLKDELMRYGLVLSAHAMETPIVTIGYEIAAQEEGTWPDSAIKAVEERLNALK